jgi:hypothetical protein
MALLTSTHFSLGAMTFPIGSDKCHHIRCIFPSQRCVISPYLMQFTSDVMTNGLTLPSLPVSQDADPIDAYDCRRPNDVPHFRCRGCDKESGITSGTLFASHKLPLRD